MSSILDLQNDLVIWSHILNQWYQPQPEIALLLPVGNIFGGLDMESKCGQSPDEKATADFKHDTVRLTQGIRPEPDDCRQNQRYSEAGNPVYSSQAANGNAGRIIVRTEIEHVRDHPGGHSRTKDQPTGYLPARKV